MIIFFLKKRKNKSCSFARWSLINSIKLNNKNTFTVLVRLLFSFTF